MRIAHFSDLHVLALGGVGWARYLNKRLTGVANLALRRAPLEELTGLWRTAPRVAQNGTGQAPTLATSTKVQPNPIPFRASNRRRPNLDERQAAAMSPEVRRRTIALL